MRQQTLFTQSPQDVPLATRMRPRDLDEFAGQQHLLGEGKILRQLIEQDRVSSMIFWGPPGVGKTTLARIMASRTKANFINFSAVTSGIKEIREVMREAEDNHRMGERTLLFVDEIHRFNKAQQDAFLPFVEKGSIVLIGATTENPSFEVNAALLSRCKVFVLNGLSEDDLCGLLHRAISDPRGFGNQTVHITDEMVRMVAAFANGDARTALGTLEMVILNGRREGDVTHVTMETLEQMCCALLRVMSVCQLLQKPRSDLVGRFVKRIKLKQTLEAHYVETFTRDFAAIEVYPQLLVDLAIGIANLVADGLSLLGVKLTDNPAF